MLIKGYEEDPLVTGDDLLGMPGFWAAYLFWLCETEDEEIPGPEFFGIDQADFDEAYARLYSATSWPVFQIPFDDGHEALVLCRNFEEDSGVELFVRHPEWDRLGHLATLDGHQAGPGLAWRELVHIAERSNVMAEGIQVAAARLLLLLPALGDAGLEPEAAGVVASALAAVGVPEGMTSEIARRLLDDHPLWEPASWFFPTAGPVGSEFAGILQCDESMSPRCGLRLAQGITAVQSNRLAVALGTWSG